MAIDRYSYPFTAIVGQDEMKLALVLNAINPSIGGVLIRGEKGTGKSTAVRALARLLPDQQVVEGCHFGCHPDDPEDWCADCRERARSGQLPVTTRRMRVVELPINASEDRVVGTIDLETSSTCSWTPRRWASIPSNVKAYRFRTLRDSSSSAP